MSRYIDAEWLKEHIEVISYEGMWHTTETEEFVAVDNIKEAPNINIVRCSECESWNGIYWWCNMFDTRMKSDDFCSHGVKKGADDENRGSYQKTK